MAELITTLPELDEACRSAGLIADADGCTWRGPADDSYVAALVAGGVVLVIEVEREDHSGAGGQLSPPCSRRALLALIREEVEGDA